MKKLEIYLNDKLILSALAEDYQIENYTNAIEIKYDAEEVEVIQNVPLNKGYKINIEV